MDFSNLLELANENKKNPSAVKGFSTAVTPAKKPPRNNVPSAAVQKFLQRKEQEERIKEEKARRQKEQLLALRASNTKSNKAAKLMASRTKDNDFSRIRLTEDEKEVKQKMEVNIQRQMLTDKVERMKARIKFQEQEKLLPHKRKRRPKTDPDAPPDKATRFEEEWNMMMKKKMPEKPAKKVQKSSASQKPLSFNELLNLASQKQHEPEPEQHWEDFEEDEDEFAQEVQPRLPQRPMTKSEQVKAMEEVLHAQNALQRAKGPNSQDNRGLNRGKVQSKPAANNPKPLPSYRTTNGQHAKPSHVRPTPGTDSIPSYSTICTSKTIEQRNDELFRKGNLKAKRGTKNLAPKIVAEPPPPPLPSRKDTRPLPSYNTVKKPMAKSVPETNLRGPQRGPPQRGLQTQPPRPQSNSDRVPPPRPQSNRLARPQSNPGRVPPAKNPYRNANLSRPVQLDEYDPSSPAISSSSVRRPLESNRLAPARLPTKEPVKERPSAAVRNKVPAGVSADNMRPARFNETANGLMQKRLPPSPSKVPARNPFTDSKRAPPRLGGPPRPSGSAPPMIQRGKMPRMPPRPPENRSAPRPAPIMRHEPFPNLARNPYRKLPPITCSRPYRIESDEEEEDDDEMRDFIDDEPNQDIDYSQHIKEIFGYDKSKYLYAEDEYDDEVVESSFAEQMKEENRSARIAMQEDYEEMMKEMEEMKEQRKQVTKKKKLK